MEHSDEFELLQPLTIGDAIPDISLKAFYKNEIIDLSIGDHKGKWLILFFYPADFTFVCPTELGELADKYEEFQKEGVEVLSISTDSAFSHKAWCDRSDMMKKVSYPMLADSSHLLSDMCGVLSNEGTSRRGTFIINPEGVIMATEVIHDSISRDINDLLRKVRALKHTYTHKGEVTPAGWKQEGDNILKPDTGLIGTI